MLGFAWMLGALSALESVTGFDARDVDVAVGTSAGSVVAGLLGCRLPVESSRRHHQGVPLPEDPPIAYDYSSATGRRCRRDPAGGRPRRGWRWTASAIPGRVSPIVALSGLLPPGRGSLQPVHDLVAAVATEAGFGESWPRRARGRGSSPSTTAPGGASCSAATTWRPRGTGGRASSARATLADAVQASCSIPAGTRRP